VRPGAPIDRDNADRAIRYLEKSNLNDAVGAQMLLGRMYMRTAAWDKAIALLSKLVEEEPDFAEAVSSLVQAYRGAGRPQEAIKLLEGNGDSSAQLSILLGELYEGERRWADAAEAYGRASRRRPRDVELKVRWATALLSEGQADAVIQARNVLRDVTVENSSHVRALYLLVQADRQLANTTGAEATAVQMVQTDPRGVWGQYALAQVAGDKKDYRKVIDTLEPLIAGWKDRSDQGQGLNPARLYEQLGGAYLGLKLYDKAIDQLQRAREGARTDVRLARLEAQALRENGQLDRGVGVLEELLSRTDSQPSAYSALAELYVTAGRIPQALGILDRAAAKLPGDTSVAFELAATLDRQKHYEEALRVFERVIASDPRHAQALNYLGYLLANRGERLQESVGYIKRALEIDPDNPAYLDSLGWAYFKLNQPDLAEPQLRKAAADLVTNSVIQDHFGDTLLKLGRLDEAIAAWERALGGDGDSIDRPAIERKIRSARDKSKKK
jgi:tetratricopeptide (TPR) repeat protein